MKKLILLLFVAVFSLQTYAQKTDKELVTQACTNYLEGFYQGDKAKLKSALSPTLHKFGFWKSKKSNKYGKKIPMTFEGAMKFAENVVAKKNYAKKGAPNDGRWMIEQVIWQGPNSK